MAFEPLSEHLDDRHSLVWVYCKNEPACGHNRRLDAAATIQEWGDMPMDRLRARLKCSKCGARARVIVSLK